MASRNLDDLLHNVHSAAQGHRDRCATNGIDLLVYCTLRDAREQAGLYRQGRTTQQIRSKKNQLADAGYDQLARLLGRCKPIAGRRVTNAGPGESLHQYGLAYDCVPMIGGKCLWRTTGSSAAVWRDVGRLGKFEGLEWAGEWTRFREFPHFQIVENDTIGDLMARHYGESQVAVLSALHLAPETEESQLLTDALSVTNTKFFVIASVSSVTESQLEQMHERAGVARNLSPDVRRVFWVRDPDGLSNRLKSLLWGDGDPTVGAVLAVGSGLNREVRQFTYDEINTYPRLKLAFAWEPA